MPAGDLTRAYPVNRTAGNLTRNGVAQVDSEITSTLLSAINSLRNRYAGASAPSPASQYMIWYDTVNAVQKMYDGANWNITTSPTINAPTPNVVLSGQVDAAGVPVLFIAGTGLACSLQATAEPAVISFMAGLDINGGIDSIGRLTADAANFWSGLPQSQTSYLYFDNTAGTITGGSTVIAPVYQNYEPAHAAGKHWINMETRIVKVSDGSAWTAAQRVFVGYAITNTTAVTSFVVYPYNVLRQAVTGPLITIIQDIKAQGTPGGTATAGLITRDLGTWQINQLNLIQGSSNEFILPPGKYEITASAPAYTVLAHQIYLYNVTDSVVTLYGTSEYASIYNSQSRSHINGKIEILKSTSFCIKHAITATVSINGFGQPVNNGPELYTTVRIERTE